jgi:hypothetical protein
MVTVSSFRSHHVLGRVRQTSVQFGGVRQSSKSLAVYENGKTSDRLRVSPFLPKCK